MRKRLLLIGGGHSHVEVIRRFALEPEPAVAVTLVSPDRHTAYSGMLPGHIAGHYSFEDCHIDLAALCSNAGVTLVADRVTALDLRERAARCGGGAPLAFDVVSIDCGSTPVTAGIPGAESFGVAIKPVPAFLEWWAMLRAASRAALCEQRIAVVGAGAGGIELVLAMAWRIKADGGRARFTVITDGPSILPGHAAGVRHRFNAELQRRGIAVMANARVQRATRSGLALDGHAPAAFDHVIWVTGAAAPRWPGASGLQTDQAGFIAVNRHLQSPSHPFVFAAGDIASMLESPRPKSGVHAVRQGPPLTENLRRALRGAALRDYHPQRLALALISMGDRRAVASYGAFAFGGTWVWRWKNRIDSAFMQRYKMTAPRVP